MDGYKYTLYSSVNSSFDLFEIYVTENEVVYVMDEVSKESLEDFENTITIDGLFDYVDAALNRLFEDAEIVVEDITVIYDETYAFLKRHTTNS